MERKTAAEYDPQLLKLYDRYVHGDIDRRQFLDDSARFAIGELTATAMPNYELDERINVGWPAYEAALKEADIDYAMHMYPSVNHGFHNDTTPRYDEAAAKLAWERTISFFNKTLKAE